MYQLIVPSHPFYFLLFNFSLVLQELSSFFDQFISTLSDVNSETRTCGASNCRVRLRKWVMDLARLAPEPETQALIRNYITDRVLISLPLLVFHCVFLTFFL